MKTTIFSAAKADVAARPTERASVAAAAATFPIREAELFEFRKSVIVSSARTPSRQSEGRQDSFGALPRHSGSSPAGRRLGCPQIADRHRSSWPQLQFGRSQNDVQFGYFLRASGLSKLDISGIGACSTPCHFLKESQQTQARN